MLADAIIEYTHVVSHPKTKKLTMRQGDAFLCTSHKEISKVHVKQTFYLHHRQKQMITMTLKNKLYTV